MKPPQVKVLLLLIYIAAIRPAKLQGQLIICDSLTTFLSQDEGIFYDCSNKSLDWSLLSNPNKIFDHVFASASLNLAFNSFDMKKHTIYDMSFNKFKTLNNILNLSFNHFESIEANAFYYNPNDQNKNVVATLGFTYLDLSNNNFKTLPLNSLKHLKSLTTVDLSSNPLRHVNFGDLVAPNDTTSELFPQLSKLYLNKCEIETIDTKVFDLFKSLKALDLSSNLIRHLDIDLSRSLLNNKLVTFQSLNIIENPLECDCHLLWLKTFLNDHSHTSTETTCLTYVTKNKNEFIVETKFLDIKTTSSKYSRKSVQLKQSSTNKAKKFNETDEEMVDETTIGHTEQLNLDESSALKKRNNDFQNLTDHDLEDQTNLTLSEEEENKYFQRRIVKLVELIDDHFICDLNLSSQIHNHTDLSKAQPVQVVELKCSVVSYPPSLIRWTMGDRNLFRVTSNQEPKLKLSHSKREETFLFGSSGLAKPFKYIMESTLTITFTEFVDFEQYSCKANHQFSQSTRPKYYRDKKRIDFIINSYLNKSTSISFSSAADAIKSNQLIDGDLTIRPSQNRPYIYYLILIIGVLFVISVFLYVFVCILMTKRRSTATKKEQIYNGSNSNYSSLNKRTATYASGSSRYGDSTLMQPLKPDVIREHQDIYTNLNHTIRSSNNNHTPPYVNLLFKSPVDGNNYGNNSSNYYYTNSNYSNSSTTSNNMRHHHLTQHSFDRNPVESTLIDDMESTSLSNSSKSYEENTEEYLEPKFDDLSKPAPKPRVNVNAANANVNLNAEEVNWEK